MCTCNFTAGFRTCFSSVIKVLLVNLVQWKYLHEESANCYYVKLTTTLEKYYHLGKISHILPLVSSLRDPRKI